MDTILMNLWNNKTSDSHRLALKSLKRRDNYMTFKSSDQLYLKKYKKRYKTIN